MLIINKLIIIFFIALILTLLVFFQLTSRKTINKFNKMVELKPFKYPRFSFQLIPYTVCNLQKYDRKVYLSTNSTKIMYCNYDFHPFFLFITKNLVNNTNILNYEWVFKLKKNSTHCYHLCLIEHRKVFGDKKLFEFIVDDSFHVNSSISLEEAHYIWYKNTMSIQARTQEYSLFLWFLKENNAFIEDNVIPVFSEDGKLTIYNIKNCFINYTFI